MLILLTSLAFFLVVGVPIAYSLGLSALAYFWIVHPDLISILPARLYAGMNSYAMIAMPLFVFMGLLMNSGGITARLIDFSLLFVGRLRGGLGLVNVIASMIFGGISGSSVSDTASVGAVLIPEMKRKGYSPEFASGITVASSTMGMIIPPSVPMVIYAYVSEESVGRLFLGGLIPGVLIGTLMLGITVAVSYYYKFPKQTVVLTAKEKATLSGRAFPALIMPLFVVGAVVLGLATATESAGLGALYAFFVGLVLIKELKLSVIPRLLRDAIQTSATVMIIIALSKLYIWILALERIPQSLAMFVSGLELPVFVILFVVLIIILLVGTFVDVSPAILLLTPVFLPAMKLLDINGIQFGVILITGLAVGLVTPPVGMCLNVCSAISSVRIGTIFKAALPFLIANLVTLILITYIPALSLWLPTILMD
jgi:tripartite ATP-independent transporter DctM subunit